MTFSPFGNRLGPYGLVDGILCNLLIQSKEEHNICTNFWLLDHSATFNSLKCCHLVAFCILMHLFEQMTSKQCKRGGICLNGRTQPTFSLYAIRLLIDNYKSSLNASYFFSLDWSSLVCILFNVGTQLVLLNDH